MVRQLQIPVGHNRKVDKVQRSKEDLRNALRGHDLNGDGKLSKEEIKKAFESLGSHCAGYRAWRALSHADADKSGYVCLSDQELEDLIDYVYKQGYLVPST